MKTLIRILVAFALGCGGSDHQRECIPGDASVPGFICTEEGHWTPGQAPSKLICQLPAGSWLMSKDLLSGGVLCPALAPELFLSPSSSPLAIPSGCSSQTDASPLAAGGCSVTLEIDCPDGSKLVLDQDMFDGGFGRLYVSGGAYATCLYQTQITNARP